MDMSLAWTRSRDEGENGDWETVCPVDLLVPNLGCCALVHGRQVALFRLDGEHSVYAVGNHDPISGSNVLSRGVVGDLGGEPVVASPVYKQHFSLASGRCLEDESVRIPTFRTRIRDGLVQIAVAP